MPFYMNTCIFSIFRLGTYKRKDVNFMKDNNSMSITLSLKHCLEQNPILNETTNYDHSKLKKISY